MLVHGWARAPGVRKRVLLVAVRGWKRPCLQAVSKCRPLRRQSLTVSMRYRRTSRAVAYPSSCDAICGSSSMIANIAQTVPCWPLRERQALCSPSPCMASTNGSDGRTMARLSPPSATSINKNSRPGQVACPLPPARTWRITRSSTLHSHAGEFVRGLFVKRNRWY